MVAGRVNWLKSKRVGLIAGRICMAGLHVREEGKGLQRTLEGEGERQRGGREKRAEVWVVAGVAEGVGKRRRV